MNNRSHIYNLDVYPNSILLFLISIILATSFSSVAQNIYSMNFEDCGGGWIDHGDVLNMNNSFSIGGWAYIDCDSHLTIMSKRSCCPYNGYELSMNTNDDEIIFSLIYVFSSGFETGSNVSW